MKTSKKGFIAPLLLALIALLVLGGGAYVYQQTTQATPPAATSATTTLQTTSTTQTSNSNPNMTGGLCPPGEVWNGPVRGASQPGGCVPSPKSFDFVSVPGMSKYADADFGFSFWYPSSWKVVAEQDSIRLYDSQGNDTYLGIEKSTPANGIVMLPGYACGPAAGCADLKYYFDAAGHTWMMQSGTKAVTPADVSVNTMGGLHMLNGNIRFGLGTIVPLSAHNFLKVGAAPGGLGGGEHNFQDYLARTIIATDPSVATPVSVAEQIKTIQAEKNAYVPDQPSIDSVVPSSVSIGSTITISGRNFDWIPSANCAGNGCAMRGDQPVSVTLTNNDNKSQVLWLGNRDSISTIPVTIPSGQPCVFASGIGGCARGAYVITPGQYTLSVSIDGRGKSDNVPITITN